MNKLVSEKIQRRPLSLYFKRGIVIAVCATSVSAQAKMVASWDCNGGSIGDSVVSVSDSVSGLNAIPARRNSAVPKYGKGNGKGTAVDFAGVDGILQVTDSAGILGAGFSKLNVVFDVDLAENKTSGTSILLRNGHDNENFNVFLQANNVIGVIMKDTDGITSSGTIKTAGRALSDTAGWQTVSVVWDGSAISILVDGVAQALNVGGTSARVGLVSLIQADAPLGIGGLIRKDGSLGQYFEGSIDNIRIGDSILNNSPSK